MTILLRSSLRTNILFKYLNLFLSVASGILLVPFYLSHLSIHEYGAWLAVGSFATWFAAMDPGIANLLIQKVSHSLGEGNRKALIGYVVAGFSISLLVAITVLSLGYYLSPEVISWFGIKSVNNTQLISAFRLAVASTATMILAFAFIGVIQGMHNSFVAGLLVTLGGIIKIGMVVILFTCDYGLLALPMAEFSAALLMLAGAAIFLAVAYRTKLVAAQLHFARLSEFLGLFAYSFGARLGKIITGNLDGVLIARLIGADQVAIYSLTATVPRQAENLINQPIAAFRPTLAYLSANASTDRLAQHIERMLRWILWLSGWVLAGLISLNGDFVRLWVGSTNFAGPEVAMALALLFWMRVWTNSTGTIGFSLGDIRRNSLAEWAYSLLLIPALIAGAMWWGLLGIAVAHIVVQLFTMAWYFPWSIWRRMQWRGKVTFGILTEGLLTIAAIGLAFLSCPTADSWPQFVLSSLSLTAIYFFVLCVISSSLRREMVHLWKSFVNK
ncbi:MAG: oligosaccharide flippase family protein [Candidatus Accumulibacter sp.]|jgi:O-antigen/teichoic acid export membrane protein|uniref:Oligosaccharide flippase family protein n=1 Tax=Candidatus Accumulibacter proximus TaxID=2954385 RepID=A0A935UFK6_9PROT|nr:oligosaccharide flippase family protein [Candidatus Accumulibacter proximus]